MNSSHEFRYLGCWKWLNGVISAHSACGYVPCWGGIRQSDSGTYWEKVRFSWLLGSGRAHACGAKLSRSWVLFPPGARLFSSLSIPQSLIRSLKKAQHYWFTSQNIDAKGEISIICTGLRKNIFSWLSLSALIGGLFQWQLCLSCIFNNFKVDSSD